MKKALLLIAFAGLFTYGHCQDVNVSINNQDATTNSKQECAYRINGICSTEDIGGVDVEIIGEGYDVYAIFKNYNGCTVTVLYEISSTENFSYGRGTGDGTTGSIVLQAQGERRIKLHNNGYSTYAQGYGIRGLIVRRMQ